MAICNYGLWRKEIYFNNDEDYAYIIVTGEKNCFITWIDDAYEGKAILDYDTYDRDKIIERAVHISKLPVEKIKALRMEAPILD